MEVKASLKYLRVSPRKVRLVADAVRKMKPEMAIDTLQFMTKSAAQPLAKTIKSAVANAINVYKLNEKNLSIKNINVNEGPTFKRGRPVSRGRWHEIKKRTTHITVVLEDKSKEGLHSRKLESK